jgi:uncharacterized membrane protein
MKSQVSIEFLVGVAFLLLIYVVSLTGFSSFTQTQLIKSESGRETCYTVAGAINAVSGAGDGFAMNVTLPYYINTEHDFLFIVLNSSTVNINWSTGFFACSVVTQNVTNMKMAAGKFSLNKINDTIYVTALTSDQTLYSLNGTSSINITLNGSYFPSNLSCLEFHNSTGLMPGSNCPASWTYNSDYKAWSFSYKWSVTKADHYKVVAWDQENTTFYAEREFDVL